MKKSLLFFLFIPQLFGINRSLNAQVLNVPEIIQEQTNWCWAGSSKCVLDYYSFIHAQCELAEYTRTVATWHNFGVINCCVDPSQGCNYWNYMYGYPGSLEDILIHFGNIHTNNIYGTLTLSEIQTEINQGKPFVFRWGWYSGGGHFLVGHGISGSDIYFMNPLPGYGYEIATYAWVLDDGSHYWSHTQTLCLPAIPGPVTGNTTVCQGSSQVYSVTPVPGATSYTWCLPSGWTGSSATNSITTTVGSTGGTITVAASNSCGASIPQSLAVSVDPLLPQPGPVIGNTDVCEGSVQIYSVSPVPGASSYTWILPAGWSGSSTTNTITATAGNSGGTISVAANNSCGPGIAQTLGINVTALPGQPGPVSGNTVVCEGSDENYSVVPVSGATFYTWTLPAGWTGSSTGNSINTIAGSSGGIISVTSGNICGNSSQSSLPVEIWIPDTSVTANGPVLTSNANSCQYQWITCPSLQPVPGALNKSFIPEQTGNYAVIISINNCSDTSNCHFVTVAGLPTIENSCKSVYPNPSSGKIFIKTCYVPEKMVIYNSLGKTILEKIIINHETETDLSEFNKGLYIIMISGAEGIILHRILLSK